MALFPERENVGTPEAVQPIPTAAEIPERIEKAGVTPIPTQFTAQLTDNNGQNVITPVVTTLQVPASATTLNSWTKGSIASSLTWFAVFWLRMIKKALFLGWRIVTNSNANSS